jgi:hypothetical protein
MVHASIAPRRLALIAASLLAASPALAQQPSDDEPPARPSAQQPQQDPAAQGQQPARGGADPSDDAFELGSPPALPEGLTEEEVWPAATAEQWREPVLVRWQRSFDDAMRVARARNMPILVCVNMDGEIASEHFAGVRYRDPETAALMSKYACVIASVYRHTPRDYDPEGNRVECPRFGTVTCGEHIEAERELYGKYFDGRRISPRHIVLDLDGEETYDVYYSWDTATVVTTYVKGREGWPEPQEPGERTLRELARSPDSADREALETAYVQGDVEVRRTILRTLVTERVVDQVEVLRTALFGFDLEMASLARQALAECETEGALDLMAEALKVPLEPGERQLLLGAVERLAQTSPRARTLAALHNGLSLDSSLVDARRSEQAALEYETSARVEQDLQARAEAVEAGAQRPDELLGFALAAAEHALEFPDRRYAGLLALDAREAADRARAAGAGGPRLEAVLALVASELGEDEAARGHAVAAVEGGLLGIDGVGRAAGAGPEVTLTVAARTRLLQLFAQARQRAIRRSYREGGSWPPEWLADVSAAYTLLIEDPRVGAQPLVEYQDFLRWIGATPRANEVLDRALERFPASPELHQRLRGRLLWEGGPRGLEEGYAERLAQVEADGSAPGQLTWFAGYAELVAAEQFRRRAELEPAGAAYGRALDLYARNAESFPAGEDSCRHYMALAHGGLARIALEQGDLAGATDALLTCLQVRPASAASQDGLGLSPVMTARMIQARLREQGDDARAARIQETLDALDPALLEPPPSELQGSGRRGGRGQPRGRGPQRPVDSGATGGAAGG